VTTIALYHPGRSLLHRLPAGAKMLGLIGGIVVLTLLDHPWQLGVAAVVIALLYAVALIPARVAWRQLVPLRWILLFVVVLQVILAGWERAVMVGGGLLLSVALAALVTLTTRVTAMLDLCRKLLWPFRRWIDADRVGLALALTIRCVPLLASIIGEVTEARKARGAGFSITALGAPAVVRALRTADQIGEALVARGVDD
jgi:biotin transport system permease protein